MNTSNHDVQEIRDGEVTDMRIEAIIDCIVKNQWSATDFDTLFNELVHEFIMPGVPPFFASRIGQQGSNGFDAVGVLMLLRLEFTVVYATSENWPGTFAYMPEATIAVSIYLPHTEDDATSYSPGLTFNQAALCAIMQYAREKAHEQNNQGELRLN